MTAFAGWVALSLLWTESVPLTALEVERALVYVAAAGALALVVTGASARAAEVGVLVALLAVALKNLLHRATSDDDAIGAAAVPVGYENGLAFLAASGALLAGALAFRRRGVPRLAAAATLPAFAAVLVLASSRGAVLALAVGALAAAAAARRPPLVLAAVAAGLVVSHAAGFAGGGERPRYWSVALGAAADHPLLGAGAGTFARVWLREREAGGRALDAHGLFVETFAELGAVGLALLVLALAFPLLVAARSRGSGIAVGVYAAFVVHAAADWDWELPAVVLVGLVAAAAIFAERPGAAVTAGTGTRALAVAGAAAVAVLALAGHRGNDALVASDAALRRGDVEEAVRRARAAERWQPWAAEPWQQLARAQLARGDAAAAARSLRRAVAHDRNDPNVWRELAVVARGEERRRAAERALRLDPYGFAGASPGESRTFPGGAGAPPGMP